MPKMPKIFWVGAFPPENKNVGDHALTLAVKKFLADKFADYKVKKFTRNKIDSFFKETLALDDLVFIHSSGDFGDLYLKSGWHKTRKRIIAKYPKNRIVQLPVSIHYEDIGNFEEDKSFFAYRPNLLILCRTQAGADLLKANFGCQIKHFPDFVFYLKPKLKQYSRDNILFVLRQDAETQSDKGLSRIVTHLRLPMRALQKAIHKDVYFVSGKLAASIDYRMKTNYILNKFPNAVIKDVQISENPITDVNREQVINEVFDYYQHFKVVVTDRFHACVFSYLTNTPFITLKGRIPQKTSPITFTDLHRYFEQFRKLVLTPFKMDSAETSANNILELIKQRRSIRSWTKQKVPETLLRQIVQAGLYAPSAANSQATNLRICQGEVVKKLCQYTSPWFKNNNPPAIILVLYNRRTAEAKGLFKEKWHTRFIWQDTSCAMMNMMLAAESLGLKTCWGSLNFKQQKAVSELLGLPNHLIVCSLLLVGYSKQEINVKTALHQGRPIRREVI